MSQTLSQLSTGLDGRQLYFAYGANLSRDSMRDRCPLALPVRRHTLTGYRLVFNVHASIVPDPTGAVHGALWSITQDCLDSLDYYEGYPHHYRRETVVDGSLEYLVYVMNTVDYGNTHGSHGDNQTVYNGSTYRRYRDVILAGYCDWAIDTCHLESALADVAITA